MRKALLQRTFGDHEPFIASPMLPLSMLPLLLGFGGVPVGSPVRGLAKPPGSPRTYPRSIELAFSSGRHTFSRTIASLKSDETAGDLLEKVAGLIGIKSDFLVLWKGLSGRRLIDEVRPHSNHHCHLGTPLMLPMRLAAGGARQEPAQLGSHRLELDVARCRQAQHTDTRCSRRRGGRAHSLRGAPAHSLTLACARPRGSSSEAAAHTPPTQAGKSPLSLAGAPAAW